MYLKKISCFLLLLIFIGSCREKSPKPKPVIVPMTLLPGSWQLNDILPVDSTGPKTDRGRQEQVISQLLSIGDMLSFFADGSYSEVNRRGTFYTGKWNYADRGRAIQLADSFRTTTIFIRHSVDKTKQVLELIYTAAKVRAKFNLYAISLKDYHDDPFYVSNNFWRYRPARPETTEELQKRLGNYFLHLLCILKSALVRNQQEVTFEFSPGIVKIYDGGIGITDEDAVPVSWINTFYNVEQAKTAYKMFQHYLMNTHYHGKGTGNWLEDDHNILQNIYNDLKSGKFIGTGT